MSLEDSLRETRNRLVQEASEELGLRYNKNKLRWSLLPFDALKVLVEVYEQGCLKYEDRNWEAGLSYEDTFNSAMRHLTKWYLGEEIDEESKLSHMAHVVWNSLALLTFEIRKIGKDDRVFNKNEKDYIIGTDFGAVEDQTVIEIFNPSHCVRCEQKFEEGQTLYYLNNLGVVHVNCISESSSRMKCAWIRCNKFFSLDEINNGKTIWKFGNRFHLECVEEFLKSASSTIKLRSDTQEERK